MDQEPKQQQQKPQIDQNALSRQLAVYGHEVQAKLMAMRVFIHGLTGLGIQVAKNLILAGPQQVTIYDPAIVTAIDMGRNFYITEQDIGKVTRAQSSIKQLKQLNPNVNVTIANDHDISTIVAGYQCVVVLDHFDRNYLIQLNKACRQKGIGFIYAGNLGLYGFTFVDFGQNHKVLDPTGEQQKTIFIAGITQQQEGVVYLHDEKKHGLSDGDTVVFREIKGMQQLNGKQLQIKVRSPDSFSIGDTTKYGAYVTGGMATEVKLPVFEKYNSLQKTLLYPYAPGLKELPICNWEHFGYPEQLHVILNGLLDFWDRNKRLPENLNKQDAKELGLLCKQWMAHKIDQEGFQFKVEQLEPKLVNCVSLFCQTQISPICSFWGGIITQQIVKLTGKYSPLRQWLHQQFFEIISNDHFAFKEQPTKLSFLQTRYADYDILFGDQFVRRVGKSNTFLIGAGALGCEFIKMFALMGFSTDKKSKVICTDDDNIQISNLNRQFLFRKYHVGRNKSEVACSIGQQINKDSHFQTVKLKVGTDTQTYFNDQFWQTQDIIVNAVDNIKARQHIDDQCVWFDKPLFESGTLGTKCHSQVVIPHHTISYNDIRDPPEEEFAVCTLKLFPYQIQHTIQWAREYFETVLALPSQDLKAFYQNKQAFIDKTLKDNKKNPTIAKDKLQRMRRFHEINASGSYEKCVEASVRIFEDAFQNQIAQLLHAYPADYVNAKTGKPYWSGLKRLPKIISVDPDDKLHVELIQATSNILASAFNLPQQKDPQQIIQQIDGIQMQKFVPKRLKSESKKDADKDLQIEFGKQDEEKLNKLCQQLLAIPTEKFTPPSPIVFEKDDPTNWHIQFMGGVSNLRARNYQINEVDNFKVKLIAGKIIPAIATATALVVGAVGVQIIKYFLQPNLKEYKQGYFKNITVNLALPLFVFNDPSPAIVKMDKEFDVEMGGPVTVAPAKFSKWDKIPIKGPVTLQQLKNQFQSKYGLEINVITYRSTVILYKAFGPEAKASKQRLTMKIQQAIQSVTKKALPKGKKYLPIQIMNCTKNGVDCLLPQIKYQF